MKNMATLYAAELLALVKTKRSIITKYAAILFATLFIGACTKEDVGEGSPNGVWQRYGSPKGYNTYLAVGDIPGEPSNRVYMCEHPGSPSAGLYKGYINGNVITWDASYHLPNAEFKSVGSERTLYFGVGAVEDAGKYRKGSWTNTCGPLKKTEKRIYYRWVDGSCQIPSSYSLSFIHPDLPSTLSKNQYYGPISAGSIEIKVTSNGTTSNYINLSEPPAGYKRLYTSVYTTFDNDVNRCLYYMPHAPTYVDQPL